MNVIKGLETIKSLQQQFSSQIQVMLVGSINSQNVREILDSTKVTNINYSAYKKFLRRKDYQPVTSLSFLPISAGDLV